MTDRYTNLIQARCQPGFAALVEKAAQSRGMSHSEYVRQAARTALQLDGFDPATVAPRDAGALCDSVNGSQRYAWIDGDQIKVISYHDAMPEQEGRTWLPVRHVDSEPFDIDRHWRLAPVYSIEGDHVRCEYPIVPKSLEHA